MTENQSKRGLSGAHLKWGAIILMAVDHFGAAILEPMLINPVRYQVQEWNTLYVVYLVMRCLGRFSFPMFCFLMVEGFRHTRSKGKYLRNLLIFAGISEVPFDLALFGEFWSTAHQNVFFTLALGLSAIWFAEYFRARYMLTVDNSIWHQVIYLGVTAGIALTAECLATDYGAVGVIVIVVLYMLRERRFLGAAFAWGILTLSNWLEIYSFPFIGAVMLYNGQRGRQNKYFFYLFYPVHLLVLYIIRNMLF